MQTKHKTRNLVRSWESGQQKIINRKSSQRKGRQVSTRIREQNPKPGRKELAKIHIPKATIKSLREKHRLGEVGSYQRDS